MDENQILEDEEFYYNFSASLRIFGQIDDLDTISNILGLEPTYTHKRGKQQNVLTKKSFDFDMWLYEVPVPEESPLDVHIQTLWSQIKPYKQFLLELKKKLLTVNIFLGYRSNSVTAGFEISHTSLEMFIELQTPFQVSVVIG